MLVILVTELVDKVAFDAVNWRIDDERAVKELCMVLFGREALVVHSVTGCVVNNASLLWMRLWSATLLVSATMFLLSYVLCS